jgi:peptidoglycan/LPS O-acetylase OafA/YrhL
VAVEPAGGAAANVAKEATLTLTLTQAWFPQSVFIWNNPSWSLGVEAFFYALFPLLGLGLVRLRPRALFVALALFWGLALLRPASYIFYNINDHNWWVIAYANPIMRLPEFLIGIALGRLFLHYGRARWASLMASAGILGWVALLGAGVLGLNTLLAGTPLRALNAAFLYEALLLVFFGMMIYGLAGGRGVAAKGLALPFMVLLGEASYAVYILQMPVASWVKGLTEHRMDPMMLPNNRFFDTLPYFLAYVAILVMASIISHRVVESPARSAIKRIFSQKERERAAPDDGAAPPVPVAPVTAEAGNPS